MAISIAYTIIYTNKTLFNLVVFMFYIMKITRLILYINSNTYLFSDSEKRVLAAINELIIYVVKHTYLFC